MSGKVMSKGIIPAEQWSAAILPVLRQGYSLKIPLSGTSMYPLLLGGRDEAIISDVKGKKLKRGDIVLYRRQDGTHVLHRIHHIKKEAYFMLGDSHIEIEGPINKKEILTYASAVVRKGQEINCNRYYYRLASAIWLILRPFRPVILRLIKNLSC